LRNSFYLVYYLISYLSISFHFKTTTILSELWTVCCSNHSPERHLWYANFSKALSRLSSSGDYKRTWQGALAVLILYIYYRLLVCATTIITCPYVHASSSYPITHPYMFSLRLPCFLHVSWRHTLNLHYTCAHHVYTMRNRCLLMSLLTLTSI